MKKIVILVLLVSMFLVSCGDKNNLSGNCFVYNLDAKADSLVVFSFEFKNDSIASIRFKELPDTTIDYLYVPNKDYVEFHNLQPSEILTTDTIDSADNEGAYNDFQVEYHHHKIYYHSCSYFVCDQTVFASRTEAFINERHKIKEQEEEERIERERLENLRVSLKSKFTEKKDDFSERTWIEPKSAPKYRSRNAIYCYFSTVDGVPDNSFRFVFQYYADDWLFIRNIIFNIDEEIIRICPKMETDCGNGGMIWEWCDVSVNNSYSDVDKEFINKIANAKSVKIKMNGRQYYQTKTMTSEQIQSIKDTYDYYIALGGKFE